MDTEKIRGFVEFYIWLLEREQHRLVQYYKNDCFAAFRPENLPDDQILSIESYEMRFREAVQHHKINYERYLILQHQIAMMKSVLGQIDEPTDGYKLNHYYALFEVDKLGLEVPDFEYYNREYPEKEEGNG